MPGMDGFETAKRIRAASTTYIVMLSARTEEIDALQGLEAGADDYVAKPFRPRELRARIDAMLRRPRHHLATPALAGGGRGRFRRGRLARAPGRAAESRHPHRDGRRRRLPHQLGRRPGRDDRPAEVDGQHEVELLPGRQAGAVTGQDVGAGVVDPRVGTTKPLPDRRGQCLDILVPADVDPQHLRPPPQLWIAPAVSLAPASFPR